MMVVMIMGHGGILTRQWPARKLVPNAFVQFRRLVKGPEARAKAEKTTTKVFKARAGEYGDGNERQADCMAIVITKKPQYGGYTQYCGGARATSAKALWKAYGKKYQKPVYTFTRAV